MFAPHHVVALLNAKPVGAPKRTEYNYTDADVRCALRMMVSEREAAGAQAVTPRSPYKVAQAFGVAYDQVRRGTRDSSGTARLATFRFAISASTDAEPFSPRGPPTSVVLWPHAIQVAPPGL